MTIQTIRKKRPMKAREAAEKYEVSVRTIYRWNSMRREDWIDEQAATREAVRAYHDDDGHSWSETATHFGMSLSAVRNRAYRARKERAEEAKARQGAADEAGRGGDGGGMAPFGSGAWDDSTLF